MEWTDEGIVLGSRRHGESGAIVELFTRHHGRHLGLVRGGAGTSMRPLLQPGNGVSVTWRARLEEHLGTYSAVDVSKFRATGLLWSPHTVYGVTYLATLVRLLPERDPQPGLFDTLGEILDHFEDPKAAAVHIVRFEMVMLSELGFGLALDRCAATGSTSDLVYVSPKTGGAVSRTAGEPWHDRMLRLPPFLRPDGAGCELGPEDLCDAFHLTGTFLLRNVLEPRRVRHPDARAGFIAAAVGRNQATPA
ncbi:DNA repair protein RecO (recombination protein O) [Bradyrhizobium sp. USDA 4341]